MNTIRPLLGVLALSLLAAAPGRAATATGMSSFEGEEEPTRRYIVSSDSFVSDSYDNMTDQSGNIVRMLLRYRANDWWDGDRGTSNEDRQRAEVKGLGAHQKTGETFDYTTTWRTNSSFNGSGKFCHFYQLKATDGDNGAPLVVAGIFSGQSSAGVRYWSGQHSGFNTVRNFSWSPATWQTLRIRIKTTNSSTSDGEVRVSRNNDSLQGVTNTRVYRPSSTDYRPKWGLYRGVDSNDPIGDDYVEHDNVTVAEVTGGGGGGGGGGITGFKRIVARHSGRDAVVQSASTSDGANIFQYSYSSGSTRNDEWEIISVGSGYYRVMNRHSGKAMVVQSASTANGANIIQWSYGGSQTNDEWAIEDVGSGYYRFINRHSGKALDVLNSGTGNSVNIQQDAWDGGTNQQWQLISL